MVSTNGTPFKIDEQTMSKTVNTLFKILSLFQMDREEFEGWLSSVKLSTEEFVRRNKDAEYSGRNAIDVINKNVYSPDQVDYYSQAKGFDNKIVTANSNFGLLFKVVRSYFTEKKEFVRPPLFLLTLGPVFFLGSDKNIVIMANMFFFAILIFSTYGIGRYLSKSCEVGLISAILVSFFPTVTALSRVIMVEFALTAFVALTFYLMLRIFTLRWAESLLFSVLSGVAIGLSSFIKCLFFVFLLSIVIFFVLERKLPLKRRNILNLILGVIIGIAISSVWYVFYRERVNIDPYLSL